MKNLYYLRKYVPEGEFSKSDQYALQVMAEIQDILKKDAALSVENIAVELKRRKVLSPEGNEDWGITTVRRYLKRIERFEEQGFAKYAGRRLRPLNPDEKKDEGPSR